MFEAFTKATTFLPWGREVGTFKADAPAISSNIKNVGMALERKYPGVLVLRIARVWEQLARGFARGYARWVQKPDDHFHVRITILHRISDR
jgi:hypothetical protein